MLYTYTFPDIQNTLLHIMGGMVQSIICSKIEKAGVFSLMTDESKARAKKEQFNNCSEMQMKVLFIRVFLLLLSKLLALTLKTLQNTLWIHLKD